MIIAHNSNEWAREWNHSNEQRSKVLERMKILACGSFVIFQNTSIPSISDFGFEIYRFKSINSIIMFPHNFMASCSGSKPSLSLFYIQIQRFCSHS